MSSSTGTMSPSRPGTRSDLQIKDGEFMLVDSRGRPIDVYK